MKSIIMIVAALMPELGIGMKGKLPWRLKTEMTNFKSITMATSPQKRNAVIMGRKTWESIPPKFRPLPDRLNIVLSRQFGDETSGVPGVVYLNDVSKIEDAIKDDNIDKVFLIGGAELYNQMIHQANVDSIILTELRTTKEVEIDTKLTWDLANWDQKNHQQLVDFVGVELLEEYHENGYDYKYVLYQR